MSNVQNETTGSETYRDDVGADGCGCPITAGFTTNGSEIEGTQRTEHRAKCWAAEPKGYAVTAAELRRIADAIEGLPGAPRHVSVDFQTAPAKGTDEEIAAGVDAVAVAVLGRPGKDRDLSGGGSQRHAGDWTNLADGQSFGVSIYQMYVPPDPKDVEIAKLRTELAAERAAKEFAQSHLGTEGAVSQPKPDTLLTEYTGRASVPVLCAAVLADGVACGARIYWNVAANAWWHLWRKGEGADVLKHTATGPSVPPVPDMQTRPQCSPECGQNWISGRLVHVDHCPNATT